MHFFQTLFLLGLFLSACCFAQSSAEQAALGPLQLRVIFSICSQYHHPKKGPHTKTIQECQDSALYAEDARDLRKSAAELEARIQKGEVGEDQKKYLEKQKQQAAEKEKQTQALIKTCKKKGGTPLFASFREEFETCVNDKNSPAREKKACQLAEAFRNVHEEEESKRRQVLQQMESLKSKGAAKGNAAEMERLQFTAQQAQKNATSNQALYGEYAVLCQKLAPQGLEVAPRSAKKHK